MKVSRTLAYAVHAMLQLARHDSNVPVPCSQLAQEGRMPERFLLQILRSLVMHGLLRSSRGVDGGYMLTRRPEEITLLDVFDAFDNPLVVRFPPLEGISPDARATLEATVSRASSAARHELDCLSLAELLRVAEVGEIEL